MQADNIGFSEQEIQDVRAEAQASGKNFVWNHDEPNSDQTAHFRFIGQHEGKPVVFDAVMYTLALEYGSKLYEIAEDEASRHFPNFKPMEVDPEGGDGDAPTYPTEVNEFIADVIYQLEEEDEIKVREHVDLDTDFGYGIGLEVALNVDAITEEVIARFVEEYSKGQFRLDPDLYSFADADDE